MASRFQRHIVCAMTSIALLLGCGGDVFAGEEGDFVAKAWTGAGGDGKWETTANWDPNGVPTASDDVTIPSMGKVLAETTILAHSLSIENGGELWLNAKNDANNAPTCLSPRQKKDYIVNVAGDCVCAGKLVLGGKEFSGTFQVDIGGNFTLPAGGETFVTAVEASSVVTNVLSLYKDCTPFTVGGTLTVENGATLHVNNDYMSGTHVHFMAKDILIDGTIDGYQRGWDYFVSDTVPEGNVIHDYCGNSGGQNFHFYTYSIGPGHSWQIGAGHGGQGGGADETYGKSYGNEYAPYLPGSPNGTHGWPAPGGASIRMTASDSFVLNGTINVSSAAWNMYGAPSGGSIWIAAKRFEMDDNAILNATGGKVTGNYKSAGGGGRVCVTVGLSKDEIDAIALSGTLPAEVITNDFEFMADVRGGRSPILLDSGEYYYAPSGTARYVNKTGSSVNIHVATEPAGVATLEPTPSWGIRSFPAQSGMQLDAPAFALDPASGNAERFSCTGYVVSNRTGVVYEGKSNHAILPPTEGPLWLTWLYAKAAKTTISGITGGSVRIGDESFVDSAFAWAAPGAPLPAIEAIPDEGYEFLYWAGELPYGKAKENPLHIMMDTPRQIRPVFRRAEPRQQRTWIVTDNKGEWLDPNNWSPANIPGLDDDVVISAGACNVSNYVECGSLTLSGTAILRLAVEPGWTSAPHYWIDPLGTIDQMFYAKRGSDKIGEVALVVKRDLVMSDTAYMGLGVATQPWRGRVSVGGDFRLAGENQVMLSAGPLDGEKVTHITGSGVINVGGTFDVGAQAKVFLNSDPVTGGSFVIRPKNFHLREGGALDVSNRGWGYPENDNRSSAPGWGEGYMTGAGYGGFGGNHAYSSYGLTYGQTNAPIHPGSPAGLNGKSTAPGLIRVHSDSMTLEGQLLAASGWRSCGGCSGGGIWLTARWMHFGDKALLDVSGGATKERFKSWGGGGRIAIEKGLSPAAIDHLAATGELPAEWENHVLDLDGFAQLYPNVTVNLDGGFTTTDEPTEKVGVAAPDSTGTFVYLDAVPVGTTLILR